MARTLTEILHVVTGVVVTALLASLSAWSVPAASHTIWWVAYGTMAAVAAMCIPELKTAWAIDRGQAATEPEGPQANG